jgi:hypothetical protein
MDAHESAHVEGAAILAGASKYVEHGIGCRTCAYAHPDPSLPFRLVDDESAPAHVVGMIEEAAQYRARIDSLGLESPAVHNQYLFRIFRLFQLSNSGKADPNHAVAAIYPVERFVNMLPEDMKQGPPVFVSCVPAR